MIVLVETTVPVAEAMAAGASEAAVAAIDTSTELDDSAAGAADAAVTSIATSTDAALVAAGAALAALAVRVAGL